MKHEHTTPRLAWVAACTVSMLLAMPAQAQLMAQSTATITGLKITLIDLNTADGIAPSMTLIGSLGGFVANDREVLPNMSGLVPGTTDGTYNAPDASFTPTLSLQSQLKGGKVTVPTTPTGTALTLGATLSASTSANLNRAATRTEDVSFSYSDVKYDPATDVYTYGTSSYTGLRTSQSVSADAAVSLLGQNVNDNLEMPQLLVSANTLVVIEGTTTMSSTINAKQVMTLQGNDPALNTMLSGGANAILNVTLQRDNVLDNTPQGGYGATSGTNSFKQALGLGYDLNGFYSNTGVNGEEVLFLENLSLPASGLLTLQQSNTFRVSMANTSSGITPMYLTMNLASVSEHAYSTLGAPGAVFTPDAPTTPEVPTIPTVPNIPEPGTWAQMGLGLIGLIAAVRRRRAS